MKKNTNNELYVTCPLEHKTYPVEIDESKRNTCCPACGKLLNDSRHIFKDLRA